MRIDGAFLKFFRILARIVGIAWILGGVVFLVNSFVVAEHRLLNAGIGVLVLIAGTAFVFTKPPTRKDLEIIRGFSGKG